jgi:hypothetical protein
MEQSRNLQTSLIVALLILVIAISVLITAYSYRGGSGIFPRFIGWVFIGLTMTECLLQFKVLISTPAAQKNTLASNADLRKKKILKEIKGFLWIGVFIVLLYLTGFLVGIPLYIFAFLRLAAGKAYKQCMIISAVATISVYILFIELLQYRLFQGVLFGG